MDSREKHLTPAENAETVMHWGWTCSDCRWYDASESKCTYPEHHSNEDGFHVSGSQSRCGNFSQG